MDQDIAEMNRLMDLSPYIRDIITAYGTMPETPKRNETIMWLKKAFVSATSDALESFLDAESHNVPASRGRPTKT